MMRGPCFSGNFPRKNGIMSATFSATLLSTSSVAATTTTTTTTIPVSFQSKRHTTRYLSRDFVETRQPAWLTDKQVGRSGNDVYLASSNTHWRNVRHAPMHPNVWASDTTQFLNPHMRNYQEQHKTFNKLLGRPQSFNAVNTSNFSTGLAPYELNTDLRYRGADRSMATNLFYEPSWNQLIMNAGAHQTSKGSRVFRFKPASKQVANEAKHLTDKLSEESVSAWWKELDTLVERHRPAVGDYTPGWQRNIRKVQEFFVHFFESMHSFEFQDGYMSEFLRSTKPQSLNDLYGIFLEMEANRIVDTHCARCGLNMHDTAFCGQGDAFSAFRQWRGTPVHHKPWAKEWLEAASSRAEALWHRASEDPYFGNGGTASCENPDEAENFYTQKQAEEMLRIYCLTKQRGKANAFIQNIIGSREFLYGKIKMTEKMQQMYDKLLDETPHPHMLTNQDGVEKSEVSRYIPGLGASSSSQQNNNNNGTVSHSPTQMRIDMEVTKFRREQKEEGVVRIPPQDWKIDTESIVNYEIDSKTGKITNWSKVRDSIEKSFLSTGLPETAWFEQELREMKYLQDRIENSEERRQQLESDTDQDRIFAATSTSKYRMFPDFEAYKAFDIRSEVISEFFSGSSSSNNKQFNFGDPIRIRQTTFSNPENVPVTISGHQMELNVTDEMCKLYGDFIVGMKVQLTPTKSSSSDSSSTTTSFDAIILGVDVSEAPSQWSLKAIKTSSGSGSGSSSSLGIISLGTDLFDVRSKFSSIKKLGIGYKISDLDKQRDVFEYFNGFMIGVRDGVLYCQLGQNSVAKPMGRKEVVSSDSSGAATQQRCTIELRNPSSSSSSSSSQQKQNKLKEPNSWDIPFRNDNSERRLEELKKAPWSREDVAPLIPNAYTPKEKIFGYTQHITQDDFMTGEYRDRLLARQFFTNAQKFRVIPDQYESAASFNGGKNSQQPSATSTEMGPHGGGGNGTASVKLQGFPGVDRRELDEGWAESPAVPQWEIETIEQALRDISGTRPGNFLRAPEEVASVELNEPWWKRSDVNWRQKEQQDSLEHPALRRNPTGTDSQKKLPFGGELPIAGSSMGIGDRLRDVVDELSRGFDLGPHGHSSRSNNHHFDTLGSQTSRANRLSQHGDVLISLFAEKLRNDGFNDIQTFVVSPRYCSGSDPKILLLSIHEWMVHGKPPSLVLVKILRNYLAEEIDEYNSSCPNGVAKLSLDNVSQEGVVSLALTNTSVWQNRRSSSYRSTFLNRDSSQASLLGSMIGHIPSSSGAGGGDGKSGGGDSSGKSHESWLVSFYVDQQTTALPGNDAALKQSAVESISQDLMARLRSLVGKNLTDATLRDYQATKGKDAKMSMKDRATTPQQLVSSTEFADLLLELGVPYEQRTLFMSALFQEAVRLSARSELNPKDFITTINTILSIDDVEKYRAGSSSASLKKTSSSSSAAASSISSFDSSSSGGSDSSSQNKNIQNLPADANMNMMLDKLSLIRDGYVADLRYMARENKRRPAVFQEFVRLCYAPYIEKVLTTTSSSASSSNITLPKQEELLNKFNSYCDGNWAPKVNEVVEMISSFLSCSLRNASSQQENINENNNLSSVEELFLNLGRSCSTLPVRFDKNTNSGISSSNNTNTNLPISDIQMFDFDNMESGPFEFENVAADRRTTLAHLAEWLPTRRAGPLFEFVPMLPDFASSSSSQSSSSFLYKQEPVYFQEKELFGLDNKINLLATSSSSQQYSTMKQDLQTLEKDRILLAKVANRILNRCFPLLKKWYQAVVVVHESEQQLTRSIQHNTMALDALNRHGNDPQQETDFRMNAERYWRRVIETGGNLGGTSSGASAAGAGVGMANTGRGGGGGGFRQQDRQQGQGQQQRSSSGTNQFRNVSETIMKGGGMNKTDSRRQTPGSGGGGGYQQQQQRKSSTPGGGGRGTPMTGGRGRGGGGSFGGRGRGMN